MLFDLRGRGRRRTVQVTYVTLAVIFGLGFVGLGVGGGFGSGGIFSAFTGNEGSGGASRSSDIKKYEQLTRRQPVNVSAWEQLVNAQLHEAGNEQFTTRTGVTSKGKELYAQIAKSWERYLALNPSKPNVELAQRMVTVYGEEGLNDPAATVSVLQIVVAAKPTSASLYSALAAYAYKAHNTRVGDLAAAKAISLAPAQRRAHMKAEFAALKKNPSGSETSAGTTAGPSVPVKSPGAAGTGSATTPSPAAPSTTKK